MLARLCSASLRGLDAEAVDVEVDLARGLPCWNLVGLPEGSVREARERVRSAVVNSGFEFPLRRITVNLAPADRRKDGSHFDLPIAVGLLLASGQLDCTNPSESETPFLMGELALDGRLNPVRGILPLVLFARSQGYNTVILPHDNADEAAAVEGITVLPADNFLAVAQHLAGKTHLAIAEVNTSVPEAIEEDVADMADIRGQQQARRVLEIAAAGGHHLLMTGSPGVGKSMLAQRLPGIMPLLTIHQAMEVTRIYSVSGDTSRQPMSRRPPLRQPHHSASDVAIVGGGSSPKPGEISKADHGILFLDELAEHKRAVLETLRQPLEDGRVCIARASDTIEFPARFQLLAAMNPCPCGYLGHPSKACRCSPSQIRRYMGRISGPLLDRFDLTIQVPPVEREELARMQPGESSASIAHRVEAARQRQYKRLGDGCCNARMTTNEIEEFAKPDAEGLKLLDDAMKHFSLSARSYHRILKVARTIADLGNAESVVSSHIAEALQYRGEDLQLIADR